MSGCFLLDLLLSDARAGDVLTERLRLAFGTGFCSSFTTYSTFLLDAVTSAPAVAVAYGIASYAGGFAAVLLGRIVVVGVEGPPSAGRSGRRSDVEPILLVGIGGTFGAVCRYLVGLVLRSSPPSRR